jgi:hypothetical protein
MSVERTFQGAWRVSDVIDGRLITRQYFDYTKREAIAAFKHELREARRP